MASDPVIRYDLYIEFFFSIFFPVIDFYDLNQCNFNNKFL